MLKNERGNTLLKFLDRWLGIPLILFLSIFRKHHTLPSTNPRRIGLLIPAAIGDTIVASPIFDALRARFPNAEITAFASSSNISIFKLLKGLDQAVNLPIKNPVKALFIIKRHGEFDWWIDFGQWARLNALYSYFSNSQFKVGFKTEGQFRHYVYDAQISHLNSRHEFENFSALLTPFQMSTQHKPDIHRPHLQVKKNQILIHIFAGGSKPYLKEWPLENWKNLIDQLIQRGHQIVLTGVSENTLEAQKLMSLFKPNSQVSNLVGTLDLSQLCDEMSKSQLVISVNTGVMHLAAAINCNLVSLQGPTSAKRWGPLNKNSTAIQSPLSCSPCLNLGYDYGCPYNNCMKAISVESVLTEAQKYLLTQPKVF